MPNKVVLTKSVSVAANTTEANVLGDTKVTNVPTDDNYRVSFLATGSASGLEHELSADVDTAIQKSVVSSQNRVPLPNEDFVDEFDVAGGSKLFLEVENTTAGPLTYFFTVILTPFAMLR